MPDYSDAVEPFVGPTVGGPSSSDTAYSDFKAGVVKAQQDQDAQLARRAATPYGQFLDALGTGLMMIPAGPLRTPVPRGGSAPLAPPRPPAASEAAGELHDILERPAASDNVVPLRPQAEPATANSNLRIAGEAPLDPGAWSPYEIPKAARDPFEPPANRNAPDGSLHWQDNLAHGTSRTPGQPDYWSVKGSDGDLYGSVHKRADGYHASTFDRGERYSPPTSTETFETLGAAKRWAESHIQGEPESADVLRAREGFSSIEGGMRESSRFEHPAAETMPSAGGATTSHEILGDQPLSRQGLAKSDAPLEARTGALIEGIDHAIEQGKKIRDSVNSYVGAAYKTLNAIHRRGTPDQLDKIGFSKDSIGGQKNDVKYRQISDHLDQAISKTRLQSDAVLYRGVGQTLADELAGLKPGQTITDKAFMSTSKRHEVASGFGSGILKTLIEIKAPKGMPALDLGLLSRRNVEQEVVLPRNTELRYVGRTSRFNKNLTPVYQFEVVPSWESESSATIGSSTRTARGSLSSTPMGDLPTSSGRRPRPSYRQSPTSESSSREARRPGLPPSTTPELLDRLGYTEKQLTRAEETLAKAEQAVKDAPASDYGDNPKFWEAVRIRDAAKRSHERAQESHQGVLDEMLDRPDPNHGKFGDARESLMFYPPERAPRPFQEDFPSGAQHEGSGIITRDPEGRPLTAPFVAGRNVVGGANQAIPESRYDAVSKGLLGKAAQNVPPGKNPGSVGVTNFNTETGIPHSIELNNNLGPKARPLVYGHEIGHAIDQFAGEIPITGIEKELYRLFNSLNNPIRTRGGNDAHPWSPRMTPRKQGYEKDEAPRELMAEAVRAYMQNPNFIKTEAPNVAARIRAYVNTHPWIKQTIQFNSLAGLGIIATEHDQQ